VKVHAEFMLSATAPEHFPAPVAPEVAFTGRSNVGKSSLLNSLVGEKLAHVSSTPGRTRTINFFGVRFDAKQADPELLLVDLPGYGYARIPRAMQAEFARFIEPYLRERAALALCVCLVDVGVPPQESDRTLLGWLQQHGRPYLVVGTKADRLSGNRLRAALKDLSAALEVERILPFSAKTGAGRDELWRAIRAAAGR
jgi:GTP-binding protein